MTTTITTHITPLAPYNFALTAGQPNYSRDQPFKTEDYVDGAYIRLLDLGDKTALATLRDVGSVDAPRLAVELTGHNLTPADAQRAADRLTWILAGDQDLRPFYAAVAGDPALSGVVQEFYGYRATRAPSVFEALVQAVMGQQIAAAVARVVRNLMVQHYGVRAAINGQEWYAFPRPETLAAAEIADLRQLKLSLRKSEYIQGIARAALATPNGFETLHELPDADVIKQLTALRGVGYWTAQWVLVRALSRPDGFPVGDLALRRTVSRLYFDGAEITDNELLAFSERWAPWRSHATAYLFAALRAGRVAGS